ncbi:MAG: tyrosine-type recombinase/integrase [Candidatus Methylomirabilis oxygeniifera]|nr:MAG: tyrosine-type recombinase/integrase [Candidatus Methylomirabilis oxyfera]
MLDPRSCNKSQESSHAPPCPPHAVDHSTSPHPASIRSGDQPLHRRNSFATYLLEDGDHIRTVQELLGHTDLATTMMCTHVLNRGGRGVQSPAESLPA